MLQFFQDEESRNLIFFDMSVVFTDSVKQMINDSQGNLIQWMEKNNIDKNIIENAKSWKEGNKWLNENLKILTRMLNNDDALSKTRTLVHGDARCNNYMFR